MKSIKKYLPVLALSILLPAALFAQKDKNDKDKDKDKDKDVQEIVIIRKGEKANKVTVEITGDKVLVNGKPADQYKDGDISVNTNRYKGGGSRMRTPRGSWNMNDD